MKYHEMLQKRSAIATQMRALNDTMKNEKRGFSDEEEKRWGGMTTELDQLDVSIQSEERSRNIDEIEAGSQQEEQREERDPKSLEVRYQGAFESLCRRGMNELTTDERQAVNEMRALNTGTGSQGGFTVPVEFRNRIVESMKVYGGIANVCQIINTSNGNPMEWAVSDGRTEIGEMLGENAEAAKADPVFGKVSLGAKKASSKIILISNELLQDSAVDIEGLIARRVGSRIGRIEASQIMKGDGTGNNVNGLINQVQLSHVANAAAAVSYEDLIELKHSVDPAYRMSGSNRFVFNDTTFKGLKLLKDSQNRPLWLPAISGVAPSTIDGDQFEIDQSMDSAAAGKASTLYGDFQSYVLRRVQYMALRRLTERYAEFDQMGFVAFHRFDGLLEDVAAISKLTHA